MAETTEHDREALRDWAVRFPPQPPWHGFGVDPAPEITAVIRDLKRAEELLKEARDNLLEVQMGHCGTGTVIMSVDRIDAFLGGHHDD